ncbi:hypothetical protein [Vibrio sp.]|uniref:hypothetical protein n=1 Tax=Vibrio sp. TaxID=678 RepID=UPI003AA8D1FF
MKILIFITTVVIAKYLGSQVGLAYNIISDPFNLKHAILDLVLYVSVYFVLTFLYNKIKVFVGNN